MDTLLTNPHCHITIQTSTEDVSRFTSLLQAGILLPVQRGSSIGAFLGGLPGFTAEYITEQVQTIFLNGTATDDMETPLDSAEPVLAISAAMPGLAGAIFRRNSLHAALRTVKPKDKDYTADENVTVTLKLFNAIARDRGEKLLRQGVHMKAINFAQFLDNRTPLLSLITDVAIEGTSVPNSRLIETLPQLDTIHITFTS